MKRLFDVLIEKLKDVEANYVALGIGFFGLMTLWSATSVVNNVIDLILEIAKSLSGTPIAG